MTPEGIATLIGAGTSAVVSIGTLIMQWRQAGLSRSNSDKLDRQGEKIDDVHAATAAIQEATGTHEAIKGG